MALHLWIQGVGFSSYVWLAGNEGMEKKMETTGSTGVRYRFCRGVCRDDRVYIVIV